MALIEINKHETPPDLDRGRRSLRSRRFDRNQRDWASRSVRDAGAKAVNRVARHRTPKLRRARPGSRSQGTRLAVLSDPPVVPQVGDPEGFLTALRSGAAIEERRWRPLPVIAVGGQASPISFAAKRVVQSGSRARLPGSESTEKIPADSPARCRSRCATSTTTVSPPGRSLRSPFGSRSTFITRLFRVEQDVHQNLRRLVLVQNHWHSVELLHEFDLVLRESPRDSPAFSTNSVSDTGSSTETWRTAAWPRFP